MCLKRPNKSEHTHLMTLLYMFLASWEKSSSITTSRQHKHLESCMSFPLPPQEHIYAVTLRNPASIMLFVTECMDSVTVRIPMWTACFWSWDLMVHLHPAAAATHESHSGLQTHKPASTQRRQGDNTFYLVAVLENPYKRSCFCSKLLTTSVWVSVLPFLKVCRWRLTTRCRPVSKWQIVLVRLFQL